jgi:hypothetical protein
MKPSEIYILIAGEESQEICLAFRALGFSAFSCDLKDCSGGHPEWHLKMDMFKALKLRHWNMVMFHPVCKYMAVSGLHWNYRVPGRAEKTEESLQQVCDCLNCGVLSIGLENPMSCISTRIYFDGIYKVIPLDKKDKIKGFKPTQIIQPYQFNEDASKATCLWLINLPPLKHGTRFPGRIVNGKERWSNQTDSGQNRLGPSDDRDELRSKTYPGIAKAMAEQWGEYLLETII